MSDAPASSAETKTTADTTPPPAPSGGAPGVAPPTKVTPVVAMTFVIVVLLTALVVMMLLPDRKDSDLSKLKAELAELAKQGSPSPAVGSGEQIGDVAARVKKDADTLLLLAERYQQLVDDTHAESVRKSAELARSEELRKRDADAVFQLRKELENTRGASLEVDGLRREIADLKTTRDTQAKELERLQQELGSASSEDIATLRRQLQETTTARDFFESRVRELESAVEMQRQKLFAQTEDELLRPALELVRNLRKLENKPDSEITTAYSRFGSESGATVVKTLSFATGSAAMSPVDAQEVSALLGSVDDGDMLLVIGYASETGNVDANRTLSSDRATNVAAALSANKRPGQLVQAVYLGQTDRFSSRIPERNQICEVWHIRKNK
ncbi:MAG: OmpA family protein [Akkermansiaceae bacterium]|nr:OmpA family protein [Akkermansiaceae bacterium]